MQPYPRDDLLDPLLMGLHIKERFDLADGEVFPISQGHQLIECAQQLICISKNLSLVQTLTDAANNLGEEVKGIDILQDVGLSVGDKNHVQLVQGLVYKAYVVLFHGGVL